MEPKKDNLIQTISNFNKNIAKSNVPKIIPADNLPKNMEEEPVVFTVDDAIEHIGFGKFQIGITLFSGLAWMADAMEMMILSILSPALFCEWGISSVEQALITTCVFTGMVFSSTIWGTICDKYGRKIGLIGIALTTFLSGAASAFSPNFTIFLVLRTLTGVCIGGLPQSITYYSEFLPTTHRGKCITLIESFWALGGVFESGIAVFVMEPLGWRWLLILSTLPLLLSAFTCLFVPESPRFLITSGRHDEAYKTLERIAQINGRHLPKGRLPIEDGEKERRGHFRDLFSLEILRTTILVLFIWFVATICYYGIILYTTVLFQSEDTCHGGRHPDLLQNTTSTGNMTSSGNCKMLTHEDYMGFVYTSFSEFPGLLATGLLIEVLGRKKTMAVEFLVFSLSILVLWFCMNRLWITIFLFIGRALICGAFQGAYVYTSEVYPTSMRAVGIGSASGMGRFGALLTPFIAQVSANVSLIIPVFVYGFGGILAMFASLLLPVETKGRLLKDRLREDPSVASSIDNFKSRI